MGRVDIKTALTLADWQAYQVQWARRLYGDQRAQWIPWLLGAAIIAAAAILSNHLGRPLSMPSLIAGILFVTVASHYTAFRLRRSSRPDPDGFVLGPSIIVLSDTGVDIVKAGSLARYSWSVVKDVTWTDQHLFVWLDTVAAIIVPLRDLPPGLESAQLAEDISAFRGAHARGTMGPEPLLPEAPIAPQRETAPLSAFKRFMRAYGALLLGRTPDSNDLAPPSRLVVLLLAAGIALWLILDWLRVGTDARFAPYAMFAWPWYVMVLLGCLWIASRLSQPRVPYERLLVLTAAFIPVVLALDLVQEQWVRLDWTLVTSIGIALYAAIYVSRTLRSLSGHRQPRAALAFAAIVCLAVWLTHSLYFPGRFWYADESSEEDGSGSDYWADMRRSEALLYAQPKRIDAAVRALQRPDDLPTAAFFVGFAGVGEQRVFAGEIALARKVVAAKFGSAQRSVLLVNDHRDLDTLPIATPTALRYALNGIATRMNVENDVLFLSLSSHGSRDGELSVSNGMFALNNLSADELATALRESGIKWKVVVVSACYAGKFIEPLRDDNTIVIAAAAADRTSFGCSDDRDLTYFGEAFYRDALPQASDLKGAFAKASEEIAARERAEGKKASNPQAHFGTALVAHLQSAFQSR
ncbi:MAG TPA: C13 family peptidase [Steroidobacteraceae bacterium]|jgi:hypothetical protein